MSAKEPIASNIEKLHLNGHISDEEYKLLLLASQIKGCRLRGDSVPNTKGYTIRFEIMLNKEVR